MRRIAAQFILTGTGEAIKHGVVTVSGDGTITAIDRLGDQRSEPSFTEFYNGIIVPGFVNCHCHLELSHMRGQIDTGMGLGGFIRAVNSTRQADDNDIIAAAKAADREMLREGIVACGDISNRSISFSVKAESSIEYVTFIEVFGIVAGKSHKRMDEALAVKTAAAAAGIRYHLTPHAVYSVSGLLLSQLMDAAGPEALFSIHFLESADERELVSRRSGPMLDSYAVMGITPDMMAFAGSHMTTARTLAEGSAHTMFVHNTAVTDDEVKELCSTEKVSWCLCPSSNMYITGHMPPATMIHNAGGRIVTGTDSLSSNGRLSILHELLLLQEDNPSITLTEMIRWATLNGAMTLRVDKEKGSVEKGKKPGLLLIENADLVNLKLLPESTVRRLL